MPLRDIDYQLLDAAKNGDIASLNALPSDSINVDVSDDRDDSSGRKPIHWAAANGHVTTLEWLVAHGADVNAENGSRFMSIHEAAWSGQISVLEWLVANGIDVNTKARNGSTPIHFAAQHGHIATMEWLIAHSAKIDDEGMDEQMPIHWAASEGHIPALAWLVAHGADVNAERADGKSSLDLASEPSVKAFLKADPLVQKLIAKQQETARKMREDLMAERKAKNDGEEIAKKAQEDLVSAKLLIKATNIALIETAEALERKVIVTSEVLEESSLYKVIQRDLIIEAQRSLLIDEHNFVRIVEFCFEENPNLLDKPDEQGITSLMHATAQKSMSVVRFLLNKGARVDLRDADGHMPIHLTEDCKVMELLLEAHKHQGVSIDALFMEQTVLMQAVHRCHNEMVQLLWKYKARIDVPHTSRLIHEAVCLNSNDVLKSLLQFDKVREVADLKNAEGKTAVMLASEMQNAEATNLLLDIGVNADITDSEGWTALMRSVKAGHKIMVEILLHHQASIEVLDAQKNTVLHNAVILERVDILKLLLQSDEVHTILNCKNNKENTALMIAVQGENIDAVNLLLQHKVNILEIDSDSNTALHMAARSGNLDILTTLLQHEDASAILDEENVHQETALVLAVKDNNIPTIEALLNAKADIDRFSSLLTTPTHVAIEHGCIDALKFLAQRGALLEIKNAEENTVLHIAAESGNMDVIQVLVTNCRAKGYSIDPLGKADRTPLMCVANAEAAKCFIQLGAAPTRITKAGESALHVASERGHTDVVKYLLSVVGKTIGINKARSDGKTALDLASNEEIRSLLLEKGAVGGESVCVASFSPVSQLAPEASPVKSTSKTLSLLSAKDAVAESLDASSLLARSMVEASPVKLISRKLITALKDLEELEESEEASVAIGYLTEAFVAIRRHDHQAVKDHLVKVIETLSPLELEDILHEVQTVLQQCEGIATAAVVSPQVDVPFESSSSDASSSSSSPSASPSDAGLKGKGYGSKTDGVSPGAMITQLEAKGLQCQIEFSRYENLPETVLSLGSKALIELIGDGPAHWVLKFTLEEKILLIWPGEVPHETLVSAEQVGIVVVSIHQNSEECAAAALNYLAVLEQAASSHSTSGQLLLEANEKSHSEPAQVADDSVETCIETSNSFFNVIIDAVMNFDPRSFVQQQLHELQELLQDGLNNVWLSGAQQFQLQALLVDVMRSLPVPMPPFKPHHDDPDGNYGGGDDPHKDDAYQDPFIFFGEQPDKDPVEPAGNDQNATLTNGSDGSIR